MIWFFIVCRCPIKRTLGLYGLKLHYAAFDLVLHCLSMSHKKNARLSSFSESSLFFLCVCSRASSIKWLSQLNISSDNITYNESSKYIQKSRIISPANRCTYYYTLKLSKL